MRSSTATAAESYPMKAGDGSHSYSKNSYFQRAAANIAKERIDQTIASILDTAQFSPGPFRVADLGCSVGPNTFISMQNIIEAVRRKYTASSSEAAPEFQVFFNDHATNDFNTLFVSLPLEREYFSAGVPGSFHGRLFPESSLHLVHSSFSLHWLSGVPAELVDEGSQAWNKGRIHYDSSAPKEVADAYRSMFRRDMEAFFGARAKEMVSGGVMVLITAAMPDRVSHSQAPLGALSDILGSSLQDMAKEGIISESVVDSFNIPMYKPSPREMEELISANGCFNIEQLELATLQPEVFEGSIDGQACTMHNRAIMEAVIAKHFGPQIVDELFDRFLKKTEEFAEQIERETSELSQLLVILKRK